MLFRSSNEFSDIAQYIQNNISSKFNLDDFTYNEVETFDESGDSLITFRYMVDDFKSDFGFNVIVIDGKVEEIVKVGEELYDLDFDSSVANDSLETSLLTTYSNETNDFMVIKLFDSKNKKFYCRVITTYVDDNGGEYCIGENIDL